MNVLADGALEHHVRLADVGLVCISLTMILDSVGLHLPSISHLRDKHG